MEGLMHIISRRSFNLALVSSAAVACGADRVFAADKEMKVVLLLSGVISDGG